MGQGTESVAWDLKNLRGDRVTAGIYLMRSQLQGTSNRVLVLE